jgi:protein phosphatase
MKWEAYALTDVGQIRAHNEDAFLLQTVHQEGAVAWAEESEPPLFAVADGVGGMRAGEVASRHVLNVLQELPANATLSQLQMMVQRSHEELRMRGAQQPSQHGMATTLAGWGRFAEGWYTFHVGDSRVYRFAHEKLTPLTKDHSPVQQLVDQGEMSRADMLFHPQKHLIHHVVGGTRPDHVHLELTPQAAPQAGELYLLCSDGLTDLLQESHLETLLLKQASLANLARRLVDLANEAGGTDNITVLLFRRLS